MIMIMTIVMIIIIVHELASKAGCGRPKVSSQRRMSFATLMTAANSPC